MKHFFLPEYNQNWIKIVDIQNALREKREKTHSVVARISRRKQLNLIAFVAKEIFKCPQTWSSDSPPIEFNCTTVSSIKGAIIKGTVKVGQNWFSVSIKKWENEERKKIVKICVESERVENKKKKKKVTCGHVSYYEYFKLTCLNLAFCFSTR